MLAGGVMALSAMLFGTGMVSASAEELCTHEYEPTVISATCTKQGYTEYECTLCGDTYKDTFVEATGHNYAEIVVKATCTEQGFTTHYCITCGYQYSDGYEEPTGHTYSETLFEPTCTEYGYTMYACTSCKSSYKDNIIERLGHDYTEDIVEATCLDGGYTTFTCNRCDETHIGNEVEAKGHSYIDMTRTATCTAYGFTEHVCVDCEDRYVDGYQKPTGHNYVDEVVPATDTELGYTKHTCETCSYVYLSDFSESKDDGYIETPAPPEEPAPHEHTFTAEATVSRLDKTVTVSVVCECGEHGEDKVSVVFVDKDGVITSFAPDNGVVNYKSLPDVNYEVNVVDEQGNVLKMFLLTDEGMEEPPVETPENPDEPENPDTPDEEHEFTLHANINEEEKFMLTFMVCECGETRVDSLKVVFVKEDGTVAEFTPNGYGEVYYTELTDGNYTIQVENLEGEVLDVRVLTIGEEVVTPEVPDEPETPDASENPDEDEDFEFTPADPNDEMDGEQTAEKEDSSLGLILGCIIFLLVVAGGVVTVKILKKKNKK